MWFFIPIICVVLLEIYLTPYTKVEESFNTQAVHDLLEFRLNLTSYDHFEFPGVVPRTFIGPLVLAVLAAPFHFGFKLCQFPLIYSLYLTRVVLSFLNLSALYLYFRQIRSSFGPQVCKISCFLTVSQFHFLFYASRPLPNSLALSSVLLAFVFVIRKDFASFIWTSAFAILIFRSELAVLLGLFLLLELIARNVSLDTVLAHGICALTFWVTLSITVDSYFWQKPIWPEGAVFYYNVILNKSSAWGTLPFHAYFTNLLLKAIGPLVAFLAVLAPFLDARTRNLLVPCVGFVLLYSFLPHKELRFVIYVVPVLNVCAARAWSYFSLNWLKSAFFKLAHLSFTCLVLLSLFASLVMLKCSMENYPGGVALERFHKYVSPKAEVNLHMDNLVCQTGAVRFGQLNPNWTYNKTEHLKPGSPETLRFSHLLVDMATDYQVYKSTHTVLFTVKGYSHLVFETQWPYLEIETVPKIVALQSKNYDSRAGRFESRHEKVI